MTVSKSHHPPFLRNPRRTPAVMGDVCIALIPPCIAAVYFFGMRTVWMLITATVTAVTVDRLSARWRHTAYPFDFSTVVTALILALSCPAGTPLWLLCVMTVAAVSLFRNAFGGIGVNLFNPAMAARAVLITVFPAYLSGYALPDTVTAATPLSDSEIPLARLIVGRIGGSIGETSVLMIALGCGWLLYRRVIRWQIPVLSTAAFVLTTVLCGGDAIRQLLSGSVLFGAVYIFTDYTGRPATPLGESIFAVGVGALTAIFRTFGRYPEGVCFAVLAMNLLTPLIEQYTQPHVYGVTRKEKAV